MDNLFIKGRRDDEVDAVLKAYDQWRRDQRWQAIVGYGQTLHPQSLLGRLWRRANKSNDERVSPKPVASVYDDQFMLQVGRIIQSLPEMQRKVVMEHYCGPSWWTVAIKAKRCGVSRSAYYEHLRAGKEAVSGMIDWGTVLVA